MDNPDGYTPVGSPVKVAEVVDPETNALMMRFQSLGIDCEFGLVQRRFGAEPLGLLRWTYTPLNSLIRILDSDFVGMGDPERTSLKVATWGEIIIVDQVYRMNNHTFIHERGVDMEKFLIDQCKRVKFLVRLMLEGLADGEKIFLFKSNVLIDRADIERLRLSLSKFGTNRLLCVEPGQAGQSATVEPIADGVALARMHPLGGQKVPGGAKWAIPFDDWVSVCRSAMGILA